MSHVQAWNLACGQWFFRFRNAVFPVVFLLAPLVLMRPVILFGDVAVDRALRLAGVGVALAGQGIRLLTIGFQYIDRGGKNKRVWASRLVQGGIYGHTRNPMYLGNLMIALGACMVSGAPQAYLIVFPFFVLVYQAIVAAETQYLRGAFGDEYVAYCRRVPAVLPKLRGLTTTFQEQRFDWRRAVRKDLSTIVGLILGLLAMSLWRLYWIAGLDEARRLAPSYAIACAAVLAGYAALVSLKKRRKLFYHSSELSPSS